MIKKEERIHISIALELIDAAGKAYQEYLEKGNRFREARTLWDKNDALFQHLLVGEISTPELQEHRDALLHHLQVWREKWLSLENAIGPNDESVFIFQNSVTFPKESAAYFRKIAGGEEE